MVVVARAGLVVVEAMRGENSPELLHHLGRDVLVSAVPADDDAAGVVEEGQAAAPQHEGVVRVWPRHQPPVLGLREVFKNSSSID